jgi:hypothetical protein
VPGYTCRKYKASIFRAARKIGTSAACSLAGRRVILTSIATDLRAGKSGGSATAAVAVSKSNTLAAPLFKNLAVFSMLDMLVTRDSSAS